MKPIYLESDEEITSVIDKIKHVSDSELQIIFPQKSSFARSIVNLKILKRQADLFYKKIFIITTDQTSQALAEKAGFKSFSKVQSDLEEDLPNISNYKDQTDVDIDKKIDELKQIPTPERNKSEYKKIAKESKKQKLESIKKRFQESSAKKKKLIILPSFTTKIILIFFAVCFVILIIAVVLILPQATVLITPKTEPFDHNLEITLQKNLPSSNIEEKLISYEIISQQKNSEERIFPATGTKDIGTKSKGQVIIYNKFSSDEQPLVASTRFVSSDGKVFRLVSDINIPGAKIKDGQVVAGETTASLEASENGNQYNIGPGEFSIPGLSAEKQAGIFAENAEVFIGGESKKVNVITSDDLKKAMATLMQDANKSLFNQLKEKVSADKYVIDSASKNEIIDSKTNGEEDKDAKDFKMSIVVKASAPIVPKEDLQKIIFTDTKKFLPENKELLDDSIEQDIKFENENIADEEKIRLKITLNKKVFTKINEQEIRQNLSGKKKEKAENYLISNTDILKSEVMLWPFWVNKIPFIQSKIKIIKK